MRELIKTGRFAQAGQALQRRPPRKGPRSQLGCFRSLGVLGVGDSPAEPLDQPRGGAVVAEEPTTPDLVESGVRGPRIRDL